MRHNALLQAMMQLVRRAGATATAGPLLRPCAQNKQDRLDIAITYGDVRLMVDVTVTATCRAQVRNTALDDITPGIATKDAVQRKLDHYLNSVEAQGKKLQSIAFDSAGCPARSRIAHRPAPTESSSEGLESEHTGALGVRTQVGPPGSGQGSDLAPQPLSPRANRCGPLTSERH
jgi:hypothetical protein